MLYIKKKQIVRSKDVLYSYGISHYTYYMMSIYMPQINRHIST